MKKFELQGDIPMNCYFIERDACCYVIDPGYEKERLIEYVKRNNLEVLGILLTHAHVDHIGALDAFDVPVYLHEDEMEVLQDDLKNGFALFRKEKTYDLKSIHFVQVRDGDALPLAGETIKVLHTPGHTVGSVCYQVGQNIYTGDTLFCGGVGKWEFPTGCLETLMQSVVHLVDTQEEAVHIHPGHGASSTIGAERSHNMFYRSWKQQLGAMGEKRL